MTSKTNPTPALGGPDAAAAAFGWKPQVGDVVQGTVVHIAKVTTGDYDPYPCLTLDTATGFINIHAFHGVLRNQLSAIRPKIGSTLKVTYLGKITGRNDREYHSYLAQDPTAEPVEYDWDDDEYGNGDPAF